MSEEIVDMKILAADQDDPTLLLWHVFPTQSTINQVASAIRTSVGAGNPYYAFHNASVPSEILESPGWEPAQAPICANDVDTNAQDISAMLADPQLQALPNDRVFED